MGEHPPLLTPQGPGVPRARRPGFPRVEDSGTSCSPFVIFRLLSDLSLFCRLRFCFLPLDILLPRSDTSSSTGLPALVAQVFPSVSFPFLASGSSDFVAACFPVHRRSSSSPISFRISVLPPRFRGSVLWPASRAEAPSHHSPGAAKDTGL